MTFTREQLDAIPQPYVSFLIQLGRVTDAHATARGVTLGLINEDLIRRYDYGINDTYAMAEELARVGVIEPVAASSIDGAPSAVPTALGRALIEAVCARFGVAQRRAPVPAFPAEVVAQPSDPAQERREQRKTWPVPPTVPQFARNALANWMDNMSVVYEARMMSDYDRRLCAWSSAAGLYATLAHELGYPAAPAELYTEQR